MLKGLMLALAAAITVLGGAAAATAGDERELVEMPPPMAAHMLANMRDHLRALEEMLGALAAGDVTTAGHVAEHRLGMSSLDNHGAAHMAPMMPEGMRAIGTEMHRAASRFVTAAQDASVGGDHPAVYAALRDITAQCNACHAAYRVR
ncbi:hypothetical protein ACM64Y_16370 [Novispirillum sp. DQ9]|uniref:hypothetical protein n=1 Tax=Novispirillum sp. DQ9 TaxID=3398612 RepID=UPI003C7A2BAB